MRLFNFLVGIILFCFISSALPTTINGRFTVLNTDSSKFTVLLQVNTNTGTDDLGGTWSDSTATPVLMDGRYRLQLTPTGTAKFYRMIRR